MKVSDIIKIGEDIKEAGGESALWAVLDEAAVELGVDVREVLHRCIELYATRAFELDGKVEEAAKIRSGELLVGIMTIPIGAVVDLKQAPTGTCTCH